MWDLPSYAVARVVIDAKMYFKETVCNNQEGHYDYSIYANQDPGYHRILDAKMICVLCFQKMVVVESSEKSVEVTRFENCASPDVEFMEVDDDENEVLSMPDLGADKEKQSPFYSIKIDTICASPKELKRLMKTYGTCTTCFMSPVKIEVIGNSDIRSANELLCSVEGEEKVVN